MIELPNGRVTRLAIKVAASAPKHLGWVRLSADGTLAATDGVVLVHSRDAHDAVFMEPIFFQVPGRGPTAQGLSYSLDLDELQLIEHRARSESTLDVFVSRVDGFPVVERALPGRLAPEPEHQLLFDSIRAGQVAKDYGLDRGVWTKGKGMNRVYLLDTHPNDTVMLAAVRRDLD